MLSLYIHIPFCQNKCNYCSFTSFTGMQEMVPQYLDALEKEIEHYKTILGEQDIKTIYFGGGTPNVIGAEGIIRIIEKIQQTRNVEDLAELSLEFNPYPKDQIYAIIQKLNQAYKKFPRVRFSFGIQSLDDTVLKWSWRPYNFVGMTDFIRGLRDIKQEHNVFNFDFIAFGKLKPDGTLRDATRINFFTKFVQSQFAESFSLYTLEQHQGTAWDMRKEVLPEDENIMKEFEILKKKITNFGYSRYEISNFCRRWCASIHNMVYRNMENYLGLWVSAASFLQWMGTGIGNQESGIGEKIENPDKPTCLPVGKVPNKPINQWVRRTNTNNLPDYLAGKWKDEASVQELTEKDILIESFFLRLRTSAGIEDLTHYQDILVPNHVSLLEQYMQWGLVHFDGKKVQLTDQGMDVSNSIITDLLEEI